MVAIETRSSHVTVTFGMRTRCERERKVNETDMKTSSKIALGAAIVAAIVLAKKKSAENVSGIGATHTEITGEVVKVEWRNHSLYGNSSYWVYLMTNKGLERCYTAPNSSLAYQISRLEGNVVTFDATIRKNGQIVLNHTKNYDWEAHRL